MHSTQRFSDRVAHYTRSRPSYPSPAIDALLERCALRRGATVADLGSGTGILTRLLLERGLEVRAVEPNAPMRAACEAALEGAAGFSSVNGSAEATTLPSASVDAVTAAQAFHWFDLEPTRAECLRILRPRGCVALLWNDRLTDVSPFLVEYEQLLHRYGIDYRQVDHRRIDRARLKAFFGHDAFTLDQFDNEQVFDFDGLLARLRSSSYTPPPNHPNYAPMLEALWTIFDRHVENGRVMIKYRTDLTVGRLS